MMAATDERLRGAAALGGTEEQSQLGDFFPLVAGEQAQSGEAYAVRSPYDGAAVANVHRADAGAIEAAIAAATEAFETTKRLASHERAAVLERISDAIAARREESTARSSRWTGSRAPKTASRTCVGSRSVRSQASHRSTSR